MTKYAIYAGLGGSLGGARYEGTYEFSEEDEATEYAFEVACMVYDSYAGLHGLRTHSEIMEEEDCDEGVAEDIYMEERENWISYYAEVAKGDE